MKNELKFALLMMGAAHVALIPISAQAACTMPNAAPNAGAGDLVFNSNEGYMQYCDGSDWRMVGGVSGGGAEPDNLGNHTATQALALGGNQITGAQEIRSNGDSLRLLTNRTDDTAYEYVAFHSGAVRQGIIIYDGSWDSCSADDTLCFKAENGNNLHLKASSDILLTPLGNDVVINGQLNMTNAKIINVTDPTGAQDAATRAYVDGRTGANETDPQVGTLENGGWCTSNGTVITCTADEPSGGGAEPAACVGGTNPQVYGGHCYTSFVTNTLVWTQARQLCQSWGGDLVIINDSSEQAFITAQYASSQGWIGLTDNGSYTSAEGTPKWWNSTAPSYTNWNASTNQHGSRDGVRLNTNGTWRYETMTSSFYKRAFVCETISGATSSEYAQGMCGENFNYETYTVPAYPGCGTDYSTYICANGENTYIGTKATPACPPPPTYGAEYFPEGDIPAKKS